MKATLTWLGDPGDPDRGRTIAGGVFGHPAVVFAKDVPVIIDLDADPANLKFYLNLIDKARNNPLYDVKVEDGKAKPDGQDKSAAGRSGAGKPRGEASGASL